MNIVSKFSYLAFGILFLLIGCHSSEKTKSLEMKCGDYQVVISCGHIDIPGQESSLPCNKNKLSFIDAKGIEKAIPDLPLTQKFHDDKRPLVLEDTSPQGVSCYAIDKKTHMVMVEYSRGEGGFTNEIFFEWFKADGEQLTQLGSPLNKKFQRPSEKNLQELPKMKYLGRDEK